MPSVTQQSSVKPQLKAKPAPDLPDGSLQVREISSWEELQTWVPAWKRLVETALEPNVFFEPEVLLPALSNYGEKKLRVLLATAKPRGRPHGETVLCGLLPLAISKDQKQTRLPSQDTWRYPQAFLTTPLIRNDIGLETLTAFWSYFAQECSAPLWVNFDGVNADGPFQDLLVQFLQQNSHEFFVRSMHRRALFRRSESAEDYFAKWSGVRRHSVTRLEKRLSEQGAISVESLRIGDDIDRWLNDFTELESQGWKGRTGTALRQSQSNQAFATEMLKNTFASNKLMMLALKLDGKPIAMKCNLLTRDGGFAWKIAYDERLYKFSPGCILEKVNIEQMHSMPNLNWMDSCAMPNHPMIDSLWLDRRAIQSISVTTARRGSHFGMAMLPMLRWVQQTIRSRFHRNSVHQKSTKTEETQT